MRVRRIHHPDVPGPGTTIHPSREEVHHLAKVLRVRAGDRITVFDGAGGEWHATVVSLQRGAADVEIGDRMEGRTDPVLPVHLYQGLCRHDRMDWIAQKGTEVGIRSLIPMISSRVEGGKIPPSRIARWRRVALEACKQSGRRTVPRIEEPAGPPGAPPSGTTALVLDPGSGAVPFGEALRGDRPEAVFLAVGPEGGFDPAEIGRFRDSGWTCVHLGPRTLRTETAGVVAAALVLHVWDDLGGRVPVDTSPAGP